MATTLTLGSSTYGPNDYLVNDNTTATDTIVVNPAWGATLTNLFYREANSATLFTDPAADVVTKVSLDLGFDNDTLVVDAKLSGTSTSADQIRMGAGNDSLTINQSVSKYGLIMAAGDDTLIFNEVATAVPRYDIKNTGINLGTGADSLVVNGNLFFTNINVGPNATDGSDTIVLQGTFDEGVRIVNFSITGGTGLDDVLRIGTFDFSAADYSDGTTGVFDKNGNLAGTEAGVIAVNEWLNLGNSITLI
jgi:hypothetical protein